MIGLLLIGKVLGPFIMDMFNPSNKKQNHDIDEMIKRKTDLLRVTGAADTTNSISTTPNSNKSGNSFPNQLKDEFQQLSKITSKTEVQKQRQNDLKRYLNLTDAIQWGHSEEFGPLRVRFEKHFDISISEDLLLKALRVALQYGKLTNDKKEIINYDDFCDLIVAASLTEILKSTLSREPTKEAQMLAKRQHCELIELQHAWFFWLYENAKCQQPNFTNDLLNLNELASPIEFMNLFGFGLDGMPWDRILHDQARPRRGNDLHEELRNQVALIKSISKLPEASTLTRKQALDLLNFEEVPAPGVLSRRYKKLAKLMHPDRIASHGFPNEIMERANKNFATIKAAYDLLKLELEQ